MIQKYHWLSSVIEKWWLFDYYGNGGSSRPEVFCKKGVLRNFAKFTGKHLCQSLLFNKVVGQACNFIKKDTLAQVFSCEFCEISKSTFFHRTPLAAASVMGSVRRLDNGIFGALHFCGVLLLSDSVLAHLSYVMMVFLMQAKN